MARAGCKPNGIKLEGDDIEKSLEVLDKVLSEFEDPDSLPHIPQILQAEPESPSQGNQSEDDGYMSMNGRRISPSTIPSSTVAITTAPTVSLSDILKIDETNRVNNEKNLEQPHENYIIIEDKLLNTDTSDTTDNSKNDIIIDLEKFNNSVNTELIEKTPNAQQTTLPKARQANVIPSKYSSLPSAGPSHHHRLGRGCGSFDGGGSNPNGRNILGIDISAVHDAVLRGGVAKLPEPILNEHPVTIYPGRSSPSNKRLVPPRTIPNSVERHREVCRNTISGEALDENEHHNNKLDCNKSNNANNNKNLNNLLNSHSSSSVLSPFQRIAITKSPSSPLVTVQQHIIFHNSFSNNQLIDNKNFLNSLQTSASSKLNTGAAITNLMQKNNDDSNLIDDSDEDFSDDSLEHSDGYSLENSFNQDRSLDCSIEQGKSLPPPPAPPLVPPPPSLSAPVTPSKRSSIAWEINLDDHLSPLTPLSQNINRSFRGSKKKFAMNSCNNGGGDCKISNREEKMYNKKTEGAIIVQRLGRSQSNGSQSSLASISNNSCGSMSNHNSPSHHCSQLPLFHQLKLRNRSSSMEWPDLPSLEQPVCTTEDEAASINSDDIVPPYPKNMVGKGTYVIRKGRKERNRLSEVHTSMSSSINSRLSMEGSLLSGATASQSLLMPNSRHSVDFGLPINSHNSSSPYDTEVTTKYLQNSAITSPRSRLSLDLGSPKKASSSHHYLIANNGSLSGGNTTPNSSIHPLCYGEWPPTSNESEIHLIHYHNDSNGNESSDNINNEIRKNNCNVNNINNNNNNNMSINSGNINGPRINTSPSNIAQLQDDEISTPRRELAPPIEEDEEPDSESQSKGAPLRQIENNISALLRGDISVARIGNIQANHHRRPLGFRPGVHKSESAKEMLLSQTAIFGPLPPSPPTSSPEHEIEIDAFPPLPPSPHEHHNDNGEDVIDRAALGIHGIRIGSKSRYKDSPPTVPPHRGSLGGIAGNPPNCHNQPSLNTLKTRSMDAGYSKKYSPSGPSGTMPFEVPTTNSSRRRLQSGAFPKRMAQSPREERCLQTSCSLPETPIFARGCDITRTPHRRNQELPNNNCLVQTIGTNPVCGSKTAPRSNTNTTNSLGSSIVGIGNSTLGGGIGVNRLNNNQIISGAEMLRLVGGPARGWYPKQQKQRAMRPVSTEHLDRLHRSQGSMRAWDSNNSSGNQGRKPLTLPPNLTPKFFNKSPREALRRVTSLLIKKGNNKEKESKNQREKDQYNTCSVHRSQGGDIPINILAYSDSGTTGTLSTSSTSSSSKNNNDHQQTTQKKKGFFKYFFKKSKHYSLDQQQ